MKTVLKVVIVLIGLISADFASAGTCRYNPNDGQWYGNAPGCIGYRPVQQVVAQPSAPCSVGDRAGTAARDGIIGAIFGLLGSKLAGSHHTGDNAAIGAGIGAVYGATLGCDSEMVADGNEVVVAPQRVSQTRQVEQVSNLTKQPFAPTGCSVEIDGYSLREFSEQEGHTCDMDKKAFIAKFTRECAGKGGSRAAEIRCGRSLD